MRVAAVALLSAALFAMAGCTTLTKQPVVGNAAAWDARRAELTPLDHWQMEGRVAIAAGRDGYSGSMAWDQQGSVLDFQFKGPFGIGGLHVWGGAETLTVRTHKGETFTIEDPETDLVDKLGWSLPFRSMRYWMAGIPDPGSAFAAQYDDRGRPLRLSQQGWTVRYDEHQPVGTLDLPRKLSIERDAVRIKVVVERWEFPAAGAVPVVDDAGVDH